jgi:hypothetical protein
MDGSLADAVSCRLRRWSSWPSNRGFRRLIWGFTTGRGAASSATAGARADRRVAEEMVSSFKRVRNKHHMFYRVAEAAVDRPDETVRDVVFPVAGGEQTLRDVVAEFKASSPRFRKNVQVKLRDRISTTTGGGC